MRAWERLWELKAQPECLHTHLPRPSPCTDLDIGREDVVVGDEGLGEAVGVEGTASVCIHTYPDPVPVLTMEAHPEGVHIYLPRLSPCADLDVGREDVVVGDEGLGEGVGVEGTSRGSAYIPTQAQSPH